MKAPASQRIIFLNALAFGIVAPLLYFMIALPDVKWIARLLVVDSLGRICGRPIANALNEKLGIGKAQGSLEAINVLGYLLLVVVGYLRPAQTPAFVLIYLSRFPGAFVSSNLPAVRLISSNPQGITIAQLGFAIGCAITAAIGNYHFLPDSIVVTGGLMMPAILAAAVSAISAIFAFSQSRSGRSEGALFGATEDILSTTPWLSANAAWILIACEAAYGMLFCVLPLTTREICDFSPMTTAIYFACFALLSVVVTRLTKSSPRSTMALIAGIILSSIGFIGISVALGLSWRYSNPNRQLHGTIAAWIAGAIGAIGHGLLRASLPSVRKTLPNKFHWVSPAVAALAALTVCRLWADHERSAFAIPAVIMLTSLPCALVMYLVSREEHEEGVTVLTDRPSHI